MSTTTSTKLVKSPLNYIGGKYKILPQIMPLFPKKIRYFVDLFTGGANVGINAKAQKIYLNDNLIYLIDLYKQLKINTLGKTLLHIENRIEQFALSQSNEKGYLNLRKAYNKDRNHLDLLVLIAYSFNHQIRFNNQHEFNNPFGRNRSSFNSKMKQNLIEFVVTLKEKEIYLFNKCFSEFDFSSFTKQDFVYCDPPYLITLGTYNDGKRGFKGWGKQQELDLFTRLDDLHKKGIRFALSNVLYHKGKKNSLLEQWLSDNNYTLSFIKKDYANSNYQTKNRDKNASQEVLVTNYTPEISFQTSLFDYYEIHWK